MRGYKSRLFSSAAFALGLAVTPAMGQGLQIEEIIVTSKQRAENLQDVPLNITAFSADDIVKQNILDVRDLAQLTPSFTYYSGTGRADPTALVVRGLSSNTSDERYQGLSIFVDGIFQSGQLTSVDLSDLERIEVIKGPQSATFGRATYSGAIDYVTKSPKTDTIDARLRAQYSSNSGSNNHNVSLRVNFPLIEDKLWMSINGTSLRRGGIGVNPFDQEPVGDEETAAFGVTLYAEPNDTTSIKLRFAHDRDRDGFPLFYVSEPAEWIADGANTITLDNGDLWIQGAVPDPKIGIAGGGEFLVDARPRTGGRDRDRYFGSLIAETEVFDGFELTYRGGYFQDKYWANSDFWFRSGVNDPFFGSAANFKSNVLNGTGGFLDNLFLGFFNVANTEEFENTSHQIRLSSPGDQALRYTAGLYYFWEQSRNFQDPGNITPTNPLGQTRGFETAQNYAAFAGIEYDISDVLTASAEARVSRDQVKWQECDFCSTTNVGNAVNDKRTLASPRVTLEYKATEDNLLYAYWSRGWKAARFNTGATSQRLPPADPERLDNFELGAKNTLLDGRAVLNVAAYYMKVRNQQAFFPVPIEDGNGATQSGVGNFGSSRVIGFELQGSVIPAEGFTLSAGIGYNDHQFTSDSLPLNDFQLFSAGQTLKGLTSVNTPKWSGNASAEYTTAIAGGYDVTLRTDLTYRSKIFVDRANLAYFPGAARVNLKATIGKDEWQLSAFARDLFDERTPDGAGLSGSSSCLFSRATLGSGQRCLSHAPPRGREIGVEAVVNF